MGAMGLSLSKFLSMTEKDFFAGPYGDLPEGGRARWQAPSNIALVKYWGKGRDQIPANASISFTLERSATDTTVTFAKREDRDGFSFDLVFEGRSKEDFKPKIQAFFERIEAYLPFLRDYHFYIETSNSFPHSSGIASSASGMAALALCLMDLERQLDPGMEPAHFLRKASFLARLGSGSACRSLGGPLVQWGEHPGIPDSSDLYGLEYPLALDPVFTTYRDSILLVDKGRKQVSSSLGHQLMQGHPYAQGRFGQAGENLDRLRAILATGDLEGFNALVESEALSLHAMMLSSSPYFILMKPATLEIIEKVWTFRKNSGLPLCFTLDAGANVHLLYPQGVERQVEALIEEELRVHCQGGQYISDRVGKGPRKLND